MVGALDLVYVPAGLALSLPIIWLVAWRRHWWGAGLRLLCAIGVSAAYMQILWAAYWNLLGYRH